MIENPTAFEEAVQSDDPRVSLEAIRDYVAHELSGSRCQNCEMSRLRTGDTAALVLRLQQIIKEIQELPNADAEVSQFELIRNRRANGAANAPAAASAAGTGTTASGRTARSPR